MNCPNCGNPVREGDLFCMNCGFRLADAAAPVAEAPAAAAVVEPVAETPVVEPVVEAPAFEAPAETPVVPVEAAPAAPAEEEVVLMGDVCAETPDSIDPVPAAPVETPIAEAPAYEVPVAPVEPVVEAPVYEAPVAENSAAPMAVAAAAPVAAVVGAVEDRLPEPPPFNPGSSEVVSEPQPAMGVPEQFQQPEAQFQQPEAPAQAVEGSASAPILAPGQFGSTTGAGAEAAVPQADAAKSAADALFTKQRSSWKDEKLNNGGIVNKGPKN